MTADGQVVSLPRKRGEGGTLIARSVDLMDLLEAQRPVSYLRRVARYW